jgi:hypothetical protein
MIANVIGVAVKVDLTGYNLSFTNRGTEFHTVIQTSFLNRISTTSHRLTILSIFYATIHLEIVRK